MVRNASPSLCTDVRIHKNVCTANSVSVRCSSPFQVAGFRCPVAHAPFEKKMCPSKHETALENAHFWTVYVSRSLTLLQSYIAANKKWTWMAILFVSIVRNTSIQASRSIKKSSTKSPHRRRMRTIPNRRACSDDKRSNGQWRQQWRHRQQCVPYALVLLHCFGRSERCDSDYTHYKCTYRNVCMRREFVVSDIKYACCAVLSWALLRIFGESKRISLFVLFVCLLCCVGEGVKRAQRLGHTTNTDFYDMSRSQYLCSRCP